MKRAICLILVISFFLSGCSFFGERIKNPVTFYYLCDNYREDLCCVIASETREASGHVGDLPYLLALYLIGPTSEEPLSTPYPGLLLSAQQSGNHIDLELKNLPASVSEIDFSLICACLALTSLDITGAEDITIYSGDRIRTLNRESLTLYDTDVEPISTEDTK